MGWTTTITDENTGQTYENCYAKVGFDAPRGKLYNIHIWFFTSKENADAGKSPIKQIGRHVHADDVEEFFGLDKQNLENSNMLKLIYDYCKTENIKTDFGLDFSEFEDVLES